MSIRSMNEPDVVARAIDNCLQRESIQLYQRGFNDSAMERVPILRNADKVAYAIGYMDGMPRRT